MTEAFLTHVKFGTEVLEVLLVFFQAEVRKIEGVYVVAIFHVASKFAGLIFLRLGQNGKSWRGMHGSIIWAKLGGAHLPSSHFPFMDSSLVTAKCEGYQEI